MTPHGRTTNTLIEAIEQSLRDLSRVPDGMNCPIAIIWADEDGQWLPIIPQLKPVIPNLFTLGAYSPATNTGPAIWLRCVLDGAIPGLKGGSLLPVLYLPHVSRQRLRAGEDCPPELKPLIELQYRGRVWHQKNGRDWTVEALLSSGEIFGLDIAQDARTKEALLRALPVMASLSLVSLKGRKLDAEDFDRLMVADPERDLLRWLNDPQGFRAGTTDQQWQSLKSLWQSQFAFDPEKSDSDSLYQRLISEDAGLERLWSRYKEAPRLYPGIARGLSEVKFQPSMFSSKERDPRNNRKCEEAIRDEFKKLIEVPHSEAVNRIVALETEHKERRTWVWAQIGESPLAMSLEPLARLAKESESSLSATTIDAFLEKYERDGWKCDSAAMDALCLANSPSDSMIISQIVRALYGPWLDSSARVFQDLVAQSGPAFHEKVSATEITRETCLLFIDGLRLDMAMKLREMLQGKDLRVQLRSRLAPLPTVTATAKPLAAGVQDDLEGTANGVDFVPSLRGESSPANAARIRNLLEKKGVEVLASDESRISKSRLGSAWTEFGHLDELGHQLGVRLALHIDSELKSVVDRVMSLIECGWSRIKIVTDHGWLLLPGGLPKVDLPGFLVETKWSRSATIRGASQPNVPTYGWHWRPSIQIACPPGVGSFTSSTEYSHGGLSPQESIIPELSIEKQETAVRAEISEVSWRGMRCRISLRRPDRNLIVDLRSNWRNPETSLVVAPKEVGGADEISLVVPDDSFEGQAATIVLVDSTGTVVDRKATTVGGE